MRRTSFASSPSRGPAGLALLGGLFVIAGLCWWLWPRDGDGAVPDLSSKTPPRTQEKPRGGPPTTKKQAAPKQVPPEDQEDPLGRAKRRLSSLRKTADPEALRRHLSTLVLHPAVARKERELWLKEADSLNDRLIWSATPGPAFTTVKVQPNDSYWTISRRVRKESNIIVTAGMLEAINKVRPHSLRLGQPMKVPKERVSLLVDKSSFTLYVLLGGVYVKRFAIGIGKDSSTPEGTFTVRGKTAKPAWTDPKTGKRHKYGEPGHLIGSRWLGFDKDGGSTGYGIHGTIEPETIGKAASEGCIRLTNDDVEALYALVPEGATVVVRG